MSETELTAAEANALSGVTDSETDAVYPEIGDSPHYTPLYKMLHRMMAILKIVNALRVYKDGDLTFGVRAGKFQDESTTRTYAGATAQALTDDDTNYIYLTDAGVLTVNTTGFPDPAVTPHIPLATVATGTASLAGTSGEYDAGDDITDYRDLAIYQVLRG